MSKAEKVGIAATTVATVAYLAYLWKKRAVTDRERKKNAKVVLITTGSRGDLQPIVTLAQHLQKAGVPVLVCTNQCYEETVRSAGVPLYVMGGNPEEVMQSPEVQEALSTGDWAKLSAKNPAKPLFYQSLKAIDEVGRMAKLIIATPMCWGQSYCIAEKYQVPLAMVTFNPFVPTKQYPCYVFPHPEPGDNEPKEAHLDTYKLFFTSIWKQGQNQVNEWRVKTLGLPAINEEGTGVIGQWFERKIPIICGFSDALVPRPKEAGAHIYSAGFLAQDLKKDTVPEYVDRFLSDLEKSGKRAPVFLCMGSMPAPRPMLLMEIAEKLASELDVAVILSAGWTKTLEPSKDSRVLLVKDSLPQRVVFPRCNIIIHHCGSGTTGAVLQSGRPSVSVPVLHGDQQYYGELLYREHAGTKPVWFNKLTVEVLVERVREALDNDEMIRNAERLRRQVAQLGSPVEKAVQAVIDILNNPERQVVPYH